MIYFRIYSLKISLVYGILEQKILPIGIFILLLLLFLFYFLILLYLLTYFFISLGLFSAPSHLEAYVRDIRVPSPSQFTNCTIDGDSNSFISRTFVVRYKDENHVNIISNLIFISFILFPFLFSYSLVLLSYFNIY